MIAAHGNSHHGFGRERRQQRARDEQRHAAEQHRTRAEAVDDEPARELHDAARHVEHADDEAEQRPRDVEFGAQQRKQRRQRQLQEVRDAVREADDADDARVPPERFGLADGNSNSH